MSQAPLDEMSLPGPQRRKVQDIFPNLNATEREFIKTGYTQEDWDKLFPPEENQ